MTDWMQDDDATIVDQEGGEHSVIAHVAYHIDEPVVLLGRAGAAE